MTALPWTPGVDIVWLLDQPMRVERRGKGAYVQGFYTGPGGGIGRRASLRC